MRADDPLMTRAKAFIEWWQTELKNRFGLSYSPNWRTDPENIATMLKDFGAKTLHRIAMQYMENPKKYSSRADLTLGVLFRYRNNILQKIDLGNDPRSSTPGSLPPAKIITVGKHTFVTRGRPRWAEHQHLIQWRIDYVRDRLERCNLTDYDRESYEKDLAWFDYLMQKVEVPEAQSTVSRADDIVNDVNAALKQGRLGV